MKKFLSLSLITILGLSVINIPDADAKNNKIPPGQAKKYKPKVKTYNYVVRQYVPTTTYRPVITYNRPGVYYFPTKYRANVARTAAVNSGLNGTIVFMNNNWVLTIR